MDQAKLRDELCELIDAQCEDCISNSQFARLEQLLREHTWSRTFYLQAMEVQGLLERFDAARDDASGPADPAEAVGFRFATKLKRTLLRRPRSVSATAAAVIVGTAIAVLAMVTAPIYLRRHASPDVVADHRPEAWLSATYEPAWGADESPAKALHVGARLHLTGGMAEVSFRSGAKAVLKAPVEIEIEGGNGLKLKRGALTARVPKNAVGFCVSTKGAVVTDLGTEFGVNVDDKDHSYVEVFAGSVRLDAISMVSDDSKSILLKAGESAAADADGVTVTRTPQSSAPAEPFVTRMPERLLVLSDAADGHYARVPGNNQLNMGTSGPGSAKVNRIGTGGEFGGNKRIMAVYYFPLPELPGGRKLLNAELRFHYLESLGKPRFAVDLYGLPGRDAANVSYDEFYLGPNDNRFTKIAAGVLQPETQRGTLNIRSQALSIYLSSLYDADGKPRVKFAVLRFNPASDPGDGYDGYAISMRENAEKNITGPHLLLHVEPEKSHVP